MHRELRIGIDLDGVIIDHTAHKLALARQFGFDLEPWQTNSNVMGEFVSAEQYRAIKEALYMRMMDDIPAVKGAFDFLDALPGELYIVSARKSGSIRFVQDWMMRHDFYGLIPADQIFFCNNKYEKRGHCERLALDAFVDDQAKVLHNLPPSVECILFDEHRIADRIALEQRVEVAGSWKDFQAIVRRIASRSRRSMSVIEVEQE